ncbi:MAG TPA: C39 family peptidase [Candidatus Babeliales bacterium]|nr:C39 family peptidase [Candidatus Babeliales bacterium]
MKVNRIHQYSFFVMTLWGGMIIGQGDEWTWLHRKIFTQQELKNNSYKKELLFSKEDSQPFSQMMFSWNAVRDHEGHVSFWSQVRNPETKQWGVWHKMMDWGNGIQRSFGGSKDAHTRYEHVRLELQSGCYADGFRIKIIAHDGASLGSIKSFAVSLSDYSKFEPEVVPNGGIRFPSLCLDGVPKKAQLGLDHPRAAHLCSPTSCSMVVGYFMNESIDAVDFAQKAFDEGLNAYGSWPFNTAHAFEECNGAVWFATARMHSFQGMYKQLRRGMPVVVSVRGWIDGAPKSYDSGHLLVVIGWDARTQSVICHDPAFVRDEDVVKYYPIQSFLLAWERSRRLVYVADPVV